MRLILNKPLPEVRRFIICVGINHIFIQPYFQSTIFPVGLTFSRPYFQSTLFQIYHFSSRPYFKSTSIPVDFKSPIRDLSVAIFYFLSIMVCLLCLVSHSNHFLYIISSDNILNPTLTSQNNYCFRILN